MDFPGFLRTSVCSAEFCKGCHYEGTIQRYYERSVKKRADTYSYDKDPDNIELENVLRQCINLISVFPLLSVYAYQPITTMREARVFISIS